MLTKRRMGIGLLLAVAAPSLVAAESSPTVSARVVALRAIDALYFEGDVEKAVQYYAEDATQGNIRDPSPAIEYIRQQQLPMPEDFVTLREIVFFTENDIDRTAKRYPDIMWKRMREPMKDGLGCLAVFEVKTPEQTSIALVISVLKEQKGEYKIVHTDDN